MPASLGQTVCGRSAGKGSPQRVHSRCVSMTGECSRVKQVSVLGSRFSVVGHLSLAVSRFLLAYGFVVGSWSFDDIALLNPRMLSPRPLPSSGSLFGPKIKKAR